MGAFAKVMAAAGMVAGALGAVATAMDAADSVHSPPKQRPRTTQCRQKRWRLRQPAKRWALRFKPHRSPLTRPRWRSRCSSAKTAASLDEEAAAGRIKYMLENPKKAGLVRCFMEWPGFVAVAGLHDGEELETKHFDRSAWQLAKRPNERERYWRSGKLRLSRLPGMESMARSTYLATLKSWCDTAPAGGCLGVEGVLDADVNQRPKKPKSSRRPYAFGSPENVDAYREASRLRYAAYDTTRALAKLGQRVEWPEGMYAPGGAVAA